MNVIQFMIYEPREAEGTEVQRRLKETMFEARSSYQVHRVKDARAAMADYLANPRKYDVLLICADDGGEKLAETVRAHSLGAAIVFVNTDWRRIFQLLIYRPSGLTPPGCDKALFAKTIADVCADVRKRKESEMPRRRFAFTSGLETKRVPYSDIVCFQSDNHKVKLRVVGGKEFPFTGKLDDVAKALDDPSFLRCHQSCIVNLAHVIRFDKTERLFIMRAGRPVEVSKRRLSAVSARVGDDFAPEFDG